MAAAEQWTTAARRGPREVTGHAAVGAIRALVVDPDERTRSILEARLGAEGYAVLVAANAEEALRHLTPEKPLPAIIVAEAQLPRTDGFALCEQLRAEERTADVPFILLASHDEATQRDLAKLATADVLLAKPVFANDVVTVVRLWSGLPASSRLLETSTVEVPLAHALRALLSSNRLGRIYFRPGRGQLSFREGRVVDATFEGAEGGEAIARMLLLASGSYTVSFGPALARATCSLGLEELCKRVFPRLARWQRLLAHSVPIEAILGVDFHELAEELDRLPEEVNQLLRLFDGRRTVRAVVTECTWDEVTTLEAINRLYALGVLAPVAPRDEDAPEALRSGAHLHLFEPEDADADARMESLFGGALPSVPESAERPGVDWYVDLAPELARQLDAFRIQSVVEPSEPPPAARPPEAVQAFGRGEELPRHEPMAVAFEAVEESFFGAEAPAPAPAVPPAAPRFPWLWVMALSVAAAALASFTVARLVSGPRRQVPTFQARTLPRAPVPTLAVKASSAAGPTLDDGVKLYNDGKTAEAAAVLAQVVDADPQSAPAWMMLGLARFDSGDNVGAEDAAVRAAELDPKAGRVHMLLASIHIVNEDKEKATAELQRYLELEPKGEFAAEAHELLAKP